MHCDAGVIESVKIDCSENFKGVGAEVVVFVDMQWLPPAVQSLSLNGSEMVREWTTAMLPRQLRFLLLWNSRAGTKEGLGRRKSIDFRKLPGQMEELYLRRVPMKGRIVIENLLESMRIVEICCNCLQTAFVDFEGLPVGLLSVSITADRGYRGQAKIVGIGTAQEDERVSNAYMTNVRRMPMTSYENMFPFRM